MAVCLSIISKKQTLTWSWSSWMMLILILQSTVGRGNATWQDWWDSAIRLPTEPDEPVDVDKGSEEGTRWAVLVAGSSGYANYRHQADVCHAYPLLRRGGVKEENIVVFMNDDIATDELNPRPGVIINRPQGQDVYAGVLKVASQIR